MFRQMVVVSIDVSHFSGPISGFAPRYEHVLACQAVKKMKDDLLNTLPPYSERVRLNLNYAVVSHQGNQTECRVYQTWSRLAAAYLP